MYFNQPVPRTISISILTVCGLVTCFLVIAVSRQVQKVYDGTTYYQLRDAHPQAE